VNPAVVISDLLPTTTIDPADTRDLGRRLVQSLPDPCVLALKGTLGAGKTQLVKGIADGLGLDGDQVTSPTFTVIHEYRKGDTVLFHVDAYRAKSEMELSELGLEDVLYGEAWCVIEWPERLGSLLPDYAVCLSLEHAGADSRRIVWEDSAP
jgi:tRNA threonylcarbamoyladenosine biosynthesis protein TsaE